MSTPPIAPGPPDDIRPGATPEEADEVERLRRLLDSQPSCLMRLGTDSLILAANDAALGQLAAGDLGQVWGTALINRFPPEQQDTWAMFAARVIEDGAASAEFTLHALDGNPHAVLLQGVRQPRHPDGIESMVVAIRELSGVKRLEQTLRDLSGVQTALAEARAQLDNATADEQRLLGALAERDAELWRLSAERAAEQARVRSLVEEHRQTLESRERQWVEQLETLRGELDQARATSRRLEEQLTEYEDRQRVTEARKVSEAAQLTGLLAEAVRAIVAAHKLAKSAGGAEAVDRGLGAAASEPLVTRD